jgi:dipeptide/tripeptide permease
MILYRWPFFIVFCSIVIHTAKFLLLSPSFDKCPVANKPEYALIGRSNVGKLSVINMRTGQKNLAKTSATPWKTQLINVLTGASFVIIALIQTNIDHGGKPSVGWQILAYAVLSASEVMVSITGLEYAYTNSPKSMKSTMSAIWLLTVAVGNLFTAFVNSSIASGGIFSKFAGASYFWLFIAILAGFLIVFMAVAKILPEKNYVLQEANSDV